MAERRGPQSRESPDRSDRDDGKAEAEVAPPVWVIEELIDRFHQSLYRYAYRLTGREADAEDLTQQTFLVAQQKLGQLREPERAQGWLWAILRNAYFKSRRRSVPLPSEVDWEALPAPEPGDAWVDRERLQRALAELPDAARVVVLMFYFENLSYKEIAAELEIPLGTVMSRLARAKQQLRTRLFRAEQTFGGTGDEPDRVRVPGTSPVADT